MIVNIATDIPDLSRLTYVCDFINNHPFNTAGIKLVVNQADNSVKEISYQHIPSSDSIFQLVPEGLFLDSKGKIDVPSLKANVYMFKNRILYSIEEESKQDKTHFFENGKFGFDFLETIFFHISRVEEVDLKSMQFVGRKLEFEQKLFSVKNGINEVPIVDDIILALFEVLDVKVEPINKPKILSHDIDMIELFKSPFDIVKKTAGIFYHRKSLQGFRTMWSSYKERFMTDSRKDPFDNFDFLLSPQQIEKHIYFLVGGKHQWDTKYSLDNPIFLEAIRLAKERQYKIGIHPSFESWNDLNLILEEKEKLEKKIGDLVEISRQHFLNFDILTTPSLLSNAGIKMDSSLGYTRHIGYRCGTGFGYFLYDFEAERKGSLKELPLVFMDMAWLYQSIREKNYALNFEKFYGAFNFHNSFFYEAALRNIDVGTSYRKAFLS